MSKQLQSRKLGDICEVITKGTTPTSIGLSFEPIGIPFVKVENIDGGIIKGDSLTQFISETTHETLFRSKLKANDILFSIAGTIGKTAVVSKMNVPANTNQALSIIRVNHQICYYRFIEHYLRNAASAIFEQSARGVGINNISLSDLRELPILLPPLPEQKRIAAILDSADTIRTKRKAAIAKLDQLAQSVFLQMFGDSVKNEGNFPIIRLADLTTKIGSGATPTGGDASYIKEGITLIRSMNIYDNEFKYKDLAHISDIQAEKLSNVIVEADDVLLNITGASVCRCSIVPSNILPARVNQHVAILRPKTSILRSAFLVSLLTCNKYKAFLLKQARSNGATREALTKSQIEELPIPLPSLAVQDKFATFLASIIDIKMQNNTAIEKEEALFSSLQHRAFTGDL